MIGECGLELINFGSTWSRNKNVNSALDHAFTNKPLTVHNYFKTTINYLDHSLICVNLKWEVTKPKSVVTTSRDLRKLRRNPSYFLHELSKIEWDSCVDMNDVDVMERFWTSKINHCLNYVAPWKTRKVRQKKICLPKESQVEIKRQKNLHKRSQYKVQNGEINFELMKELKKQNNYTNKLIKKAVREKTGKNITSESSVNEIWKSVNDVLRPESTSKTTLKIETENQTIKDQLELAEKFSSFFKEKVKKLASRIKNDKNIDPLSKLSEKLHDSKLKFKLKTFHEKHVLKILKSLKSKKSYSHDGITAEVFKLGAEVLASPLNYIINTSILTGKHPTNWKVAKVIPLHKKDDKKLMKNYRPISLLSVPGMALEKIVALQIEEFFEENSILGSFQFGFQRNENTISELLTVFDTLLEAKELKKEIIVLLYDFSAAFDTVSHEVLLAKLKMYGFDTVSMNWMKSFLDGRKQMF